MNFQQAITRLGKYHPQLSLISDQFHESSDAMRIFDLKAGEELTLKAFGDYDYLYALRGHAFLHTQDGQKSPLLAGSQGRQRFLIPAKSDAIRIEATDHVLLYQVDGDELDFLVALNEVVNLLDPGNAEAAKRAQLVKYSKAFRRLPVESIVEAIRRLKQMPVKAGQEVIRQGDPGDAYYIIEEGEAHVWELGLYDDEPQLVNELAQCDSFGEEALVMEGSRTATVRMTKDGSLLILDKSDFNQLVKTQMVDWVDADRAKSLLDGDQYHLLDVRYEEEYEESYIPGSTLIPLQQLRRRFTELAPDKSYVAYCKGGKRSAVACLLLKQRDLNVVSLTGGIMDWPYDIVQNY